MKDEQTGKRMSAFSPFQRRIKSTRCKAIDADWILFCPRCKEPIALLEECDTGFMYKKAFVTQALARMAGVPAYVISPCKTNWLVRQVTPTEGCAEFLSHEEMEDLLLTLHDTHECKSTEFPDEGKRWDKTLRCDVWAYTGTHRFWDYERRRVVSVHGIEGEPCPWVEPDESQELQQSAGLGRLQVAEFEAA